MRQLLAAALVSRALAAAALGAVAMATAALVVVALAAAPVVAEPAIVYSLGGKFDKSFNESAFRGVERYAARMSQEVAEFEPSTPAQFEQALRRYAGRGHDPVVAIGFLQVAAVEKVAAEFPDTRFAIVDAVAEGPNIRSVVFREHEGAYLAGIAAASTSQTGIIGFVGGMDIPLIQRFACAYAQGALAANPEIKVLVAMTGDTPAAFADPVRGAELARSQIDQGADVIMQAAGGTGVGVLQAAAEAGILGIGTDSDQNGLHPGAMLASVVKRVDVAVVQSFDAARSGTWQSGIYDLGLKEGGIELVGSTLIEGALQAYLLGAFDMIVAGERPVHNLYTDGPCPFL
ncbi:MAG: BMP family ABC transporter substrate-binding protein [Pseudomonadota bacterium]